MVRTGRAAEELDAEADAAGWLGLVVPVVLPEVLELLELFDGEDAPAELFVTADAAGAVGLWLAPPDVVLWLVEEFPDSAKARARRRRRAGWRPSGPG